MKLHLIFWAVIALGIYLLLSGASTIIRQEARQDNTRREAEISNVLDQIHP
jgi:hypothetical protein